MKYHLYHHTQSFRDYFYWQLLLESMIFAFVVAKASRASKCLATVLTTMHSTRISVVVSDVDSQIAFVLEHLFTVRALSCLAVLSTELFPAWKKQPG